MTESETLRSGKSETFREGVVWNFASIVLLALSGLVLNIGIAKFYDAAILGVFNQVLSAYIFFAMFAVGGINLSALKLISESPQDREKVNQVVVSSVLLTLGSTVLVTALFWLLRGAFAALLESPGVEEGMLWVTPGLFFFGLNKTLMSIVNGLGKMKTFAIFQALRYFNLMLGLFLMIGFGFPGNQLAGVFSFSEMILFFGLMVYLRRFWRVPENRNWTSWLPFHIRFGFRGFLSGALLELNARVDILMIGYFLSDAKAGIYSFGALFFEGFMQFLIVLQNNYNPRLSQWLHAKEISSLLEAFRKGRWTTYKYAAMAVPAVVLLYPLGLQILFSSQPEFAESWLPFSLLMCGLFISSGYLPFHNILLMGGFPAVHTLFIASNVASNILFNAICIPMFGISGAALGTALAMAVSNWTLVLLTKCYLGIRLGAQP